jgi:hypothetical protein
VTITLQPIRIRTGSKDTDGRLAIADGELVAVFVRLDDEVHGEDQGRWFLETAYGSLHGTMAPLFDSLAEAEDWCRAQVAQLYPSSVDGRGGTDPSRASPSDLPSSTTL